MTENCNSDPNPEPSKPKRIPYKAILKVVFKAVSVAWSLYKYSAKLIDFVKEIAD